MDNWPINETNHKRVRGVWLLKTEMDRNIEALKDHRGFTPSYLAILDLKLMSCFYTFCFLLRNLYTFPALLEHACKYECESFWLLPSNSWHETMALQCFRSLCVLFLTEQNAFETNTILAYYLDHLSHNFSWFGFAGCFYFYEENFGLIISQL